MKSRRKAVKSVRSAFAMSPLKKQKNKSRLRKGRGGISSMRFEEFVMKRGKNWPGFGKVGHPSGAGSLGFKEFSAALSPYARYRSIEKEKRSDIRAHVLEHRKAKHQRKKRLSWLKKKRASGLRGTTAQGPQLSILSRRDVEGKHLPAREYRTPGKGELPPTHTLSRSQLRRAKSKRRRSDREHIIDRTDLQPDTMTQSRPKEHHGPLSQEERKQVWAKRRSPGGYKADPVRRALHKKGKEYLAVREAKKSNVLHGRISHRVRVAEEKRRRDDQFHGRHSEFQGVYRTNHWPYSANPSSHRKTPGMGDMFNPHAENAVERTHQSNVGHLKAMWTYHLGVADGHDPAHVQNFISHTHGATPAGAKANRFLPAKSQYGHGQAHMHDGMESMNLPPVATEPHHNDGGLRKAPKYLPFDTVVKHLQKRKPLPGTGSWHDTQTPDIHKSPNHIEAAEPYTGHMDSHDWKLHHGQISHAEHPRKGDGPSNRAGEGVNSPGATWSEHGSDEKLRWKEVHGPGPRIDSDNGDDTPAGLNRTYGTQGHHAYPEHLYGRPSGGSVVPRRLTTMEARKEGRETHGTRMLDPSSSRYNPERYKRWQDRREPRLHQNPHSNDGLHHSWYDHADEDHPSMSAKQIRNMVAKTGDQRLVEMRRETGGQTIVEKPRSQGGMRDDERDRLHDKSLFKVPAVRPQGTLEADVAERLKAHALKGHIRVMDEFKPMTHSQGNQARLGVGINNSYTVGKRRALPLPEHVEYIGNSNQVVDYRGRTREEVTKEKHTQDFLNNGMRTASWWTSSYPEIVPIDHEHHPGGFSEIEYEQMMERARLLKTPFKKTQPPRNPRLYSKIGQTAGMGELRSPHDEAAEQAVSHIKHPGERQKALTKEIYNRTPENMLTRREKIHKRTLDAIESGRASPAAIRKYRSGGINHTKEMAGVPPRKGKYQVIRLKHRGGEYEDGVYPDGYYNLHLNPSPEKLEELKHRYMQKQYHFYKHVRGMEDDQIRDRFSSANLARAFHMGDKHGFAFRDEMREMGHTETKSHMEDQQPLGPGSHRGKGKHIQDFYNAFDSSRHHHTSWPDSFKTPTGEDFELRPNRIRSDVMPSSRGVESQQRVGKRGRTAAVQRWEQSDLNVDKRREDAIGHNRSLWEQQKRREERDRVGWEAAHEQREYNLRKRHVDHPDYPGDEYEREWSDTDPVTGEKFPARGQGVMGGSGMTYHRGSPPAIDPTHERYAQAGYRDIPEPSKDLPTDPEERRRYIASRSPAMRQPPNVKNLRSDRQGSAVFEPEIRSRSTSEPYSSADYEYHGGREARRSAEEHAIRSSRTKESDPREAAYTVHGRRIAAQGKNPFPHMTSEFRSQNPYLFGEGLVAHFAGKPDPIPQPPDPRPEPKSDPRDPGRDDPSRRGYGDPDPWKRGRRGGRRQQQTQLPSNDEHEGRIRSLEKKISRTKKSARERKRSIRAGIAYPLLTVGSMLHKGPRGENEPPTGFHEFRSKRDYKKNKRNTNKTPHATKGRKGRRPPRRPGLTARKQFADWHDWFPDEKTTQREWKSWYPDDKGSPPSGNFWEFMAKSRRHQRNIKKQAAGEEGMTHTGKHLGGAGGKQGKKVKVDDTLTGGSKTTMGEGGIVRMLTPGELQGQRERAREQSRSSLSKRRKKEILDELRAQGKLHEFVAPLVAAAAITAGVHVAKKYGPKLAKAGWKWGKKALGLGASAAAGGLAGAASGRGKGGGKKPPSGTRRQSLVRQSTRSRPDEPGESPSSRPGSSKAHQAGQREERSRGKLRGLGRRVKGSMQTGANRMDSLANLNRRGEGKQEVEDR